VSPNSSGPVALPELWHWPDDLAYDAAGRPRDARPTNSWLAELEDVEPVELAEAMMINAMAPFALCSRLEPLLRRSRFADRYVVNVSAMEGKFSRGAKTSRHPHTNMAKAALNMLTRTAAGRLAERGIYMNSVDTGWVTEENPHPKRARLRSKGFVPPLDEVDGASRVCDPVVRGVNGERMSGLFLKDYRPVAW
jgi:NAD(P)-dependent dehydrogenase (short-subunit alcohol dehydrogenase family)